MSAVIVTGDRHAGPDWNPLIAEYLTALPKGSIVLHGAATGIDSLADAIACECGHDVRPYPVHDADWKALGKAAGPIRNSAMLKDLLKLRDEEGYEIRVLAFHNHIGTRGGTYDMVKKARAKGVETIVYRLEGRPLRLEQQDRRLLSESSS